MAAQERVLITGGGGFVGAGLVRTLLAAGQDVHLLLRPQTNPWRLAGLKSCYTVHSADLLDARAVRQAVRACRPEVVYHLATHGLYASQRERASILGVNVVGTGNLLDALEGSDYRVLVHTGTGAEYGPKDGPSHEADPLRPRTDYAVAKAAATLLCQSAACRGQPIVTVRIFSAYGPWEDPGRLVPYVMGCGMRRETPRLSAGWQQRDFIYAGDVLSLLQAVAHQPKAIGQILHAGTGREHSVREMVRTILAVCGEGQLSAEFGAEALRPGEPCHYLASIDRTTALTGWRPRHDLRSGVEDTWAWFKSRQSLQAA